MKFKPLYTLPEVARLLGLPRSTVHKMADRRVLATVTFEPENPKAKRYVALAALEVHGLIMDSVKCAMKLNRGTETRAA